MQLKSQTNSHLMLYYVLTTYYTLFEKSVHSFTVDRRAKWDILGGTALKCDSIIVWSAVKPQSNFMAITNDRVLLDTQLPKHLHF